MSYKSYYIYYLSGPISATNYGITREENIKNFKDSAQFLRDKYALKIISPIEIEHIENSNWHQFMQNDCKALLECNAIILLKGWTISRGAKIELALALALDMPVFYFDTEQLVNMNF